MFQTDRDTAAGATVATLNTSNTKYNVARKFAKRNGAIIYANFVGTTLVVVYPSYSY